MSTMNVRSYSSAPVTGPTKEQFYYHPLPFPTKKPFEKILVANRGEIACRVIQTARRMGIKTVAVYSEADSHSKFVKLADEAVCVGPAPSKESYLVMEKIVDACVKTGAQAVHPGYGFLSENNAFAAMLEKRGIVFIGPPASAIDAMGDKIHSKKLAKEAGVSVIPGFLGEITGKEHLLKISNEIGYPVMMKASAGGGGKGMRVAWNDEEAWEGFQASKEEAASSFGDDRMLVEKYIDRGRHIEIQVMADGKDAVYFFERECSIQRRNQKVVEEAPSPFLDASTRAAMGAQAVALAKAVGYRTAGTVEFLVDEQQNFYFLEMNTRLQVEHPITEMISGHDLVEHMIRIAAGEPLRVRQEDLKITGWAIESRVYAEDPYRNFLPSIGRLTRYVEPQEVQSGVVRCDSGILEGSEISVYYDPLICKLVTWGPTREEARAGMRQALDSYVIRGVGHNVSFLRSVMDNQSYIDGNTTTKFIPEEYPTGFHGYNLSPDQRKELLVATAAVFYERTMRNRELEQQLELYENNPNNEVVQMVLRSRADPKERTLVSVSRDHVYNTLSVEIDGTTTTVNHSWDVDSPLFQATFNESEDHVLLQLISAETTGLKVQYAGTVFDFVAVEPHIEHALDKMPIRVPPDRSKQLVSPMPGKVVRVSVKPGDKVVVGQPLVVVSAMKMLNQLKSTLDGVVKAVHVKQDDDCSADQTLIDFE